MKITAIKSPISFKSGYPTFGGCGHLREVPEVPPSFKGAPGPFKLLPEYSDYPMMFRPQPGGILKLDIMA